jgi:apolipoprotein N-acyltransferase
METYKRLTRKGYDFQPQLIVWPETSVPFFFQDNERFSPTIFSLAQEAGAVVVFGSPAYEQTDEGINYYNRAYLLAPGDRSLKYYNKVHLVPFGEYVPLKKFLFFIKRLVPAAGDFKAGDKIEPINHSPFSVGIIICFEAIFPELARAYARGGANILLNLTNDAWFGMTSAPYQHLSMAVFRAVENRIPMIRAANTGFSAFINHHGKIISLSPLFTENVLNGSVDIPNFPLTFYARFGDLFAFSLLMVSFIKILSSLFHVWITKK